MQILAFEILKIHMCVKSKQPHVEIKGLNIPPPVFSLNHVKPFAKFSYVNFSRKFGVPVTIFSTTAREWVSLFPSIMPNSKSKLEADFL